MKILKKLLIIILLSSFHWQTVLALEAAEAFRQAKNYYDQNNFTQAASLLYKAAEQGHMNAQSLLGSMYLIGKGIPKDARLAIYWLKTAATQGQAEAQSLLGAIYLVGQDAPQDFVQAKQWLQKAVEQGLADAQYLLGMMYYQGQGVPENHAQALQLLSLAAEQEHPGAIQLFSAPPTVRTSPLPKIPGKYRLTVNAIPAHSHIRIMNIKPKYQPGIALKPDRYDISVTSPGYFSKRMWVKLKDADLVVNVNLDNKQ